MARELMPKSGSLMPYVVASREAAITGVSSVDGVGGAVSLVGKYLTTTQGNALQANVDMVDSRVTATNTTVATIQQTTIPDINTAINGKANKGVNNDITALTGLTTAIPIASGGTGAKTPAAARNAIAAAAAGENADITKLTNLAEINRGTDKNLDITAQRTTMTGTLRTQSTGIYGAEPHVDFHYGEATIPATDLNDFSHRIIAKEDPSDKRRYLEVVATLADNSIQTQSQLRVGDVHCNGVRIFDSTRTNQLHFQLEPTKLTTLNVNNNLVDTIDWKLLNHTNMRNITASTVTSQGGITANANMTVGSVEILPPVGGSGTAFIDFHHNRSTADYTQRIASSGSGLTLEGGNLSITNGKVGARGGLTTKAGYNGGLSNNGFNAEWNVSSQLYLWIDAVAICYWNGSSWASASDKVLKKDIQYISPSDKALSEILQWKPATFKFKERGLIKESSEKLGFIANDLIKISPDVVDGVGLAEGADINSGNPLERAYNLDQMAMIAKLTQAVQTLTKRIEELESK